ncbi:ABC transporter substrate-binding protein [Nocardioides sp. cx-173]|uniref:ABC transporter substrate-binding protein n=1 Tax=Nocardioides sp. cx-173 TaxID=2898796 RepID=UPI001E3C5685|nr:ABC transporter substrate-binding protein [Nocardioides sp. cx-173]MCD4524228.1 ABC transporter substrate-binding protein [Nocardioides sp. cx-173]UGB41620.1 ABC transporter substrate-binding protein [Nocardioides sp. cx-173]
MSAATLALAACSGTESSGEGEGAQGGPVSGGSLTLISNGEPRGLDPAVMQSQWAYNAGVGAALYGGLLYADSATGEITPHMAESWETADNGKTFTLKLREGLTFSDGTPLDASAVKFNWDRMKDPAIAPAHSSVAAMVETNEVVDDTTLKVTMVEPTPQFAQGIVQVTMNWIASPKALAAGPDAFNANPVGAGPFTLVKWTPNDVIELEKNQNYFEGPDKPYLDKLVIRTLIDTNQRYNTLISDGADVITENSPVTRSKLEAEGYHVVSDLVSGGSYMSLNALKPPFDDVRARQAVAAAIDLDVLNDVLYQGKGTMSHTLFTEDSPFYSDKTLDAYDPEKAEELFDELAAEGKPVTFEFLNYGSTEIAQLGESLITQLSKYDNVKMTMRTIEISAIGMSLATGDYDMAVNGALFTGDPEPRLSINFISTSTLGRVVNDPEIDKVLQEGRLGKTLEERKAAYDRFQDLLIEKRPAIFYTVPEPALIFGDKVGGVDQQSMGTPKVEDFWIAE